MPLLYPPRVRSSMVLARELETSLETARTISLWRSCIFRSESDHRGQAIRKWP